VSVAVVVPSEVGELVMIWVLDGVANSESVGDSDGVGCKLAVGDVGSETDVDRVSSSVGETLRVACEPERVKDSLGGCEEDAVGRTDCVSDKGTDSEHVLLSSSEYDCVEDGDGRSTDSETVGSLVADGVDARETDVDSDGENFD
jgi:hypothetical protein